MTYFRCAIITISLFAANCYAGQIITEYVVWGSSFTVAQRNAIKEYGRNNDRQPAIRTMLEPYGFDNLYKLRLTTYTDIENTAIVNALNVGKIQKLNSFEIITEFDGRQQQTYVGNRQTYMPEPHEFTVEVTTP